MDIVDSRIDLTGKIMIAKEAESSRTHPIILQWMLMACDPESVERETCDELPVTERLYISIEIYNASYKITKCVHPNSVQNHIQTIFSQE